MKVFGRQIVVVNSPDAIRYVVAKRHENFERKTPQMRRALEFLLGDACSSPTRNLKQRRPLVNDIVYKNRVPAFGKIMENTTSELVQRWESPPEGAPVNALFEMAGLGRDHFAFGFRQRPRRRRGQRRQRGVRELSIADRSVNIGYFLGFDDGLLVLRTPKLRRLLASTRSSTRWWRTIWPAAATTIR